MWEEQGRRCGRSNERCGRNKERCGRSNEGDVGGGKVKLVRLITNLKISG